MRNRAIRGVLIGLVVLGVVFPMKSSYGADLRHKSYRQELIKNVFTIGYNAGRIQGQGEGYQLGYSDGYKKGEYEGELSTLKEAYNIIQRDAVRNGY